jgi:endoribonuclease Dicer
VSHTPVIKKPSVMGLQVTLLVATSVAEEGLDIRQCNVVIRFDLAKTVLAYIQSRGRARKPGSDYILMLER